MGKISHRCLFETRGDTRTRYGEPEVIQRSYTNAESREKVSHNRRAPNLPLFHRGRETGLERFTTAGGGKVTRHVESPLAERPSFFRCPLWTHRCRVSPRGTKGGERTARRRRRISTFLTTGSLFSNRLRIRRFISWRKGALRRALLRVLLAFHWTAT